MANASPICFRLLTQEMLFALSLATFNAGSSIAARIAMIAITMSNSINVKLSIFPEFPNPAVFPNLIKTVLSLMLFELQFSCVW